MKRRALMKNCFKKLHSNFSSNTALSLMRKLPHKPDRTLKDKRVVFLDCQPITLLDTIWNWLRLVLYTVWYLIGDSSLLPSLIRWSAEGAESKAYLNQYFTSWDLRKATKLALRISRIQQLFNQLTEPIT